VTDSSMTYLLVPGAFQGGWAWRPVAQRLRAKGHRAITLTLPGLGDGDDPEGLRLQDAADYIADTVGRLDDTNVSVVGHSWSAFPIAGAAPRLAGRVTEIIYYNAHIPLRNRSQLDDIPVADAAVVRRLIETSPQGAMAAPFEMVQHMFFQDAAEQAQLLLTELLTPQPGAYFIDAVDVPSVAELGIPCRYILGDQDHALFRPGAEFAARLGLAPIMVPGTHQGLLTHPDDVSQAILT
jgi:pimeloyl-ACP methyl ester carboxylesterase